MCNLGYAKGLMLSRSDFRVVVGFPKKPEGSARIEKLSQRSIADFTTAVEEDDPICMFDRRKAVSDQNLRHLPLELPYRPLNVIF